MKHISYSELKEWNVCPWKHKLNYINRINEFKGNEHTAFGTTMHTVCENLVLNGKLDSNEFFDKEFVKNLSQIKEKDPHFVFKKDLVEQMRLQGVGLIKHILPSLRSYFGKFDLISIEEKLYTPIEDQEFNFKGFVDLVVQTKDGKYHIIDWKTCSWGWDNRKKNEKMITYQLTLYKHFWSKKHDVDPKDVITHFALLKRTAKHHHVELFKVTSGQKKTQNALKLLDKALYNIEKQRYLKKRSNCHKCAFNMTKECP